MDHNPFLAPRTTTATLPRTGVTVTIREPTLDEGMRFAEIDGLSPGEKAGKVKEFVASLITWDATDRETHQPLPVTPEAIGYLPVEDGNALVVAVMGFINPPADEKKGPPPSAAS